MILWKVELLVMAILLSKNIAQCDDRAQPHGATTAQRSVRLGLGRTLILDEALVVVSGATALLNATSRCAVSECCIHVVHCCC